MRTGARFAPAPAVPPSPGRDQLFASSLERDELEDDEEVDDDEPLPAGAASAALLPPLIGSS